MSQDHFDRKLRDRLNAIESDVPASIWDGIASQKFDQQFRDRIAPYDSEVPEDMWNAIAAAQFDQSISSKLNGFESVVPTSVWVAVEEILHKKKDRTPILILLLLLMISGGAIWIGLQSRFEGEGMQDQTGLVLSQNEELSASFSTQDGAGIKPPSSLGNAVSTSPGDGQDNLHQVFPINIDDEQEPKDEQDMARREALPSSFKQGFVLEKNLSEIEENEPISQVEDRLFEQSDRIRGVTSTIDLVDLSGVSLMNKPRIECPTLKVSRSLQPFFELTVSPGFPLRSLEDSADNETYLESRRDTERPTMSVSIDAAFGLEIKDFEIKSGISFSQIYEVFDYIDQTSTRTVIDTVFDPNSGEIVDISIVREYGTRVKKTNNRYTFVDIPLIVGYRLKPRKDHSLWLRAGGYLNLFFAQRGSILSASDDLIDLKEEGSNIFKKTAGVQAMASIAYEIDFGEKSSLGLQLSYRHPLNQLTLDSYPIRQQYQQLQVGFSWKHKL